MQSSVAVSTGSEEFSTNAMQKNGHETETNGGLKDMLYEELFGDVEKRSKPGPKSKKTKRVPIPQTMEDLGNIFQQVSDPIGECPEVESGEVEKVKPRPKSKKSKRVPDVVEESNDVDNDQDDLAHTELDEVTDNMIGEELNRSFNSDNEPLQIDKISPQTEDVAALTEDIQAQTEDITQQTEDIPPLSEDIPPQTEDMIEDIPLQIEDPPEEVEGILPETEEILPEIEEAPSETEESADIPAAVEIEDVTDVHISSNESSAYIDTEPSHVHLATDSEESDDQPSMSSVEDSFKSVVEPSSSKQAECRPPAYVPFISARRPLYSSASRPSVEPLQPGISCFSFLRQSPTLKRKADESMDREPKRTKSEGFFSRFAAPVLDRLRGKGRAVVEDDMLDEGIVLDAGDLSGVGADDVVGKEELPADIPVAEPARNWCALM